MNNSIDLPTHLEDYYTILQAIVSINLTCEGFFFAELFDESINNINDRESFDDILSEAKKHLTLNPNPQTYPSIVFSSIVLADYYFSQNKNDKLPKFKNNYSTLLTKVFKSYNDYYLTRWNDIPQLIQYQVQDIEKIEADITIQGKQEVDGVIENDGDPILYKEFISPYIGKGVISLSDRIIYEIAGIVIDQSSRLVSANFEKLVLNPADRLYKNNATRKSLLKKYLTNLLSNISNPYGLIGALPSKATNSNLCSYSFLRSFYLSKINEYINIHRSDEYFNGYLNANNKSTKILYSKQGSNHTIMGAYNMNDNPSQGGIVCDYQNYFYCEPYVSNILKHILWIHFTLNDQGHQLLFDRDTVDLHNKVRYLKESDHSGFDFGGFLDRMLLDIDSVILKRRSKFSKKEVVGK